MTLTQREGSTWALSKQKGIAGIYDIDVANTGTLISTRVYFTLNVPARAKVSFQSGGIFSLSNLPENPGRDKMSKSFRSDY